MGGKIDTSWMRGKNGRRNKKGGSGMRGKKAPNRMRGKKHMLNER